MTIGHVYKISWPHDITICHVSYQDIGTSCSAHCIVNGKDFSTNSGIFRKWVKVLEILYDNSLLLNRLRTEEWPEVLNQLKYVERK